MNDVFDVDKPAHAAARARLDTELIMWLITTTADGTPHPAPVWFLWHDGVFRIVSEPEAYKAQHLRRGSKAVLHLDGGRFGDDIAIFHGDVRLIPDGASDFLARFREPFLTKYEKSIDAYGMPIEELGRVFSTVIEFTPTRLTAWAT
ncbi:pyridoxamine 5'-phosphate oxidase family protein [Microbacterium sp. Sa4CUA7]|uniref:Pyridoxamine 5'-phosphate oxidase family protein n=1 Tax=Microbacterium pullorum TaxID=2762236 RepID=A0ABR8RYX9_9MICO|nr:pyridoxamine 5'-phosphate oxidase family protein [Microbacterium pullorum]MBD7956456.1 pyridoxamine 5'-phosphate oxidase family protein [Microbacterium pullorum]